MKLIDKEIDKMFEDVWNTAQGVTRKKLLRQLFQDLSLKVWGLAYEQYKFDLAMEMEKYKEGEK